MHKYNSNVHRINAVHILEFDNLHGGPIFFYFFCMRKSSIIESGDLIFCLLFSSVEFNCNNFSGFSFVEIFQNALIRRGVSAIINNLSFSWILNGMI